jgi:3-dehydrosphinganine reductase
MNTLAQYTPFATPATSTAYNYLTTLLLLAPLLYATMVFFARKDKFPVAGRCVIITGGSQGLGLSVAQKLSARGANIVLVARDKTKLASALQNVSAAAKSPATQRFLTLSYDLTLAASAPAILQEVSEWNGGAPPDVLWNAAGLCLPTFFADASLETLRGQMDTLYWSAAYMAHAVLQLWTKPDATNPNTKASSSSTSTTSASAQAEPLPRHIIFTCSTLACFPVAGYTAYSPAKAAMKALADALQMEVQVYNGARASKTLPATQKPGAEIKIHTLMPMGISSPNFEIEEKLKPSLTKMLEETDKPETPDQVADAALMGLDAGEVMIATNFIGKLMVGEGMGSTLRMGVADVFYNMVGSLAVTFVGWEFDGKVRKWGREKGMMTGPP